MLQSICVFCGSNPGKKTAYKEVAMQLGRLLALRGQKLIYGGAALGLMGAVADCALAKGGWVTGVIPQGLVEKEIAHSGLSEMHVVETMHERKALMAELSDAFIILPGGSGTMDEFFEIWTWAQLGMHTKPIGLLNLEGYYDHLIRFIDHQVSEGFIRKPHAEMLIVSDQLEDMLNSFEDFQAPVINKWVEKDDI
jgi:uncharacterized protein (TIGR00730 family)